MDLILETPTTKFTDCLDPGFGYENKDGYVMLVVDQRLQSTSGSGDTMPRSLKPKMSNDVLAPFDSCIDNITYDEGCLVVSVNDINGFEMLFDEKDLESMLSFLRSNKMKEKI